MENLLYGKLLSSDAYAQAYSHEPGFELVCIAARQQRNLEFLRTERPDTVLEVGCGPVLLSTMPGAAETGFRRWAIAEPAQSYAASARAATAQDARFSVIEGYLEACCDALKELAPDGYEAAIVSSLVHETTNPLELLTAVASLMKSGGKILVSAPNAFSFHRLLAEACGLIRSPHELSAMDRRLGHTTVFDPQSLSELVGRAGFTSLRSDGCLFKPFTNAQMQTIMEAIGPRVESGLISLGRRFPQNAAEICSIGEKP